MNNLNSILVEGNLVRDPLLRTTHKGTQVCTISIASNRYYKLDSGFEREVSFFTVETWGRLAEACYQKGRKGRGIRVVGRLKQDRWNGTDGKPRSRVSIVAEHVEFRPEYKKDDSTKTITDEAIVNADIPYEEDLDDEESDTAAIPNEEELEAVAF